jgi:hypothetical protein
MISATGTPRQLQRWLGISLVPKGPCEGLMTAQKSFGLKLLIAKALLSFVAVAVLAATAHAEDCLAAPNSAAREGTRWYYRLDRATQRKCWYMRAPDQLAQQATVTGKKALPQSAFAIPIPRPRPSTADSSLALRPADTDQSSSHAGFAIPIPRSRPSAAGSALALGRGDAVPALSYPKEIAVKPSATPQPSGTPSVIESTAETTSSIPKESTSPQASTSSATVESNATPLTGAAIDETTSAISEMHQIAPSPETHAAATAAAPNAASLAGATTNETSVPTSNVAAPRQAATSSEPNAATLEANAAPQIIAPIDDASSTPNDSAAQPSNSSNFRSNDAEPMSDVSVAQPQAPLAASSVNAQPTPLDAPDWTARRVELIDNARMLARPFPLIFAFVLALVGLLIRAFVARGLGRVFIN